MQGYICNDNNISMYIYIYIYIYVIINDYNIHI